MHFIQKIGHTLSHITLFLAVSCFYHCSKSTVEKADLNSGTKPIKKIIPKASIKPDAVQVDDDSSTEEDSSAEDDETIVINADDMFLKLGESDIKLHLRRVPKGSFMMGITDARYKQLLVDYAALAITKDDEVIDEAARSMSIEHDYFIGKYEVSKEQFAQFDSDLEYSEEEKNIPITNISEERVFEFCAWLSKQYEGYEIRVPTETEWEYAAKGATEDMYTWGMEYDKNKANLESDQLLAVGSKVDSDSWIGASDMLGNASEICSIDDVYQKNDEYAVVSARGGRYFSDHLSSTTTTRHLLYNAERDDVGFRIVVVPLEK